MVEPWSKELGNVHGLRVEDIHFTMFEGTSSSVKRAYLVYLTRKVGTKGISVESYATIFEVSKDRLEISVMNPEVLSRYITLTAYSADSFYNTSVNFTITDSPPSKSKFPKPFMLLIGGVAIFLVSFVVLGICKAYRSKP